MKLIASLRRRNGNQSCSPSVQSAMDFTTDQKEAIKQLQNRVSHKLPPALQSDYELYKWLAARGFDVDKSEAMIEKSLVWRKKWSIDSLLEWEAPEVLLKYNPSGLSGFDKEGSPVWIIPFGDCDIRGIFHSCSEKDYIRYQLAVLERSLDIMRKHFQKTNKIIRQVCIFDMENFPLKTITWKPSRDAILKLVQMYEGNYPELLKCCYAVNVPRIFSTVMTLIKPFLHQETIDKIKIYSASGWKEALLETIPADQLPIHWGGTLCDPDGNTKCPSMICIGGEVPKSYYLKNKVIGSDVKINSRSSMKILVIPTGGKETLQFKVDQPASSLTWEFCTEEFDVGFGISRLLSSGVEEVLITQHRVDCELVPEEGSLCCVDPGIYEVTFDNQYSYLRPKKIFYKLEIIPPSDITKL